MPAIFNVSDFLKIGIMAFLFIFAANWLLSKAGLEQFKA